MSKTLLNSFYTYLLFLRVCKFNTWAQIYVLLRIIEPKLQKKLQPRKPSHILLFFKFFKVCLVCLRKRFVMAKYLILHDFLSFDKSHQYESSRLWRTHRVKWILQNNTWSLPTFIYIRTIIKRSFFAKHKQDNWE